MNKSHKAKKCRYNCHKGETQMKIILKNILTNEVSHVKLVSGLVGTNYLFEIFG